ncbi:MAG: hypothetical protein JXD21_05625 [Candidatus Omnitrophica bacterium]|nr:hypothetical protein [Candidatus Omnitrophota bacterium]
MRRPFKPAVTLIELIISVVLFSVIMLGIVAFDSASRRFLRSTERRTKVVNEVMFILDHISKTMSTGIGDITDPGIEVTWQASTEDCNSGSHNCIIDVRTADPADVATLSPPYTNSIWQRYEYDAGSHTLSYFPDRDFGSSEVLSANRIVDFQVSSPASTGDCDRIQIDSLVLRYEDDGPDDDPTNNPTVTLDDVDIGLTSFSQSCR